MFSRYLILVLFLFNSFGWSQTSTIPAFGTDNTLEIATWNIENFPKNGQTTIDYVTQIIQALDLDIIAFQEISDPNLFVQMLENLPNYSYNPELPYNGGLAYIYKTDLIQINDFYEIYTASEFYSPFPRSPLVMDLNYLGQNIYIINNHLKCCGDGILELNDLGDEETRRYIASNLLKQYIDTNLPNKKVLVVGDMNDEINEPEQENVFYNIIYDSQNYLFTDMEIANGSSTGWSYPSWPSHLDHILITNELFQDFQAQDSEIKVIKVEQYLQNGWYEYDTNVSDHRPVVLKLNMQDNLDVVNLTSENLFTIYPNPATNFINLIFNEITKDSRIEMYNLMGQMISSKKLNENLNKLTIELDNFSKGIYTIRFYKNDSSFLSKKFVIY